ncbi:hypothetical protein NDQ86_10840 [Salinispora arenicola]|nr:hypothetical protein [Salinispora arenicola]MCN0152580.1 hypothetical protein [Salinispora arenicola]
MANLSGLEVWLTGTPTELAAAGRLAQRGQHHPMAGADTGRCRLYLRLTITTTRRPARPTRPADTSDQGATVLPFPGRRTG